MLFKQFVTRGEQHLDTSCPVMGSNVLVLLQCCADHEGIAIDVCTFFVVAEYCVCVGGRSGQIVRH